MKQITILFFFSFTLIISSCSNQQKEIKTSNLLKLYDSYLLQLDSTDITTIPSSVTKYKTLFKDKSVGLKDSAFVLFSLYYEKVDRNINQIMEKDTTNFDPLISLDSNMKPLPISDKLKKYKERIEQNGFEISSTEGSVYLKQDRDYIAKNFYGDVSKTMKVYLEQVNKENKEGFQEDAGITIEAKTFVDRVIWWENFIANNNNFMMLDDAKERKKYLLTFLITGMDNSQVLTNENSDIDEYYKTAYTYLQITFQNSQTNKLIAPYFKALLEKNKTRSAEIIKDYKRRELIIDFHE